MVTWEEPEYPNAPTLNYTITYMNLLSGQVEIQVIGPDVLTSVLPGLDPFTMYSVTVMACSEAGCGLSSDEVTQLTPEEGKLLIQYSGTSNKGPSKKRTVSLERTVHNVPKISFPSNAFLGLQEEKTTGQPLYSEQNGWSQCALYSLLLEPCKVDPYSFILGTVVGLRFHV